MNNHKTAITFLSGLLKNNHILPLGKDFFVSYFKSGAGTHLYLITGGNRKYLARVNYYPLKNDWGVKEQEYKILRLIEPLRIAPRVYCLSRKNSLKQHFTIVDFVDGKMWNKITDTHIIDVAKTLKKLHVTYRFKRTGDTLPPKDQLPYTCDIYDTYAQGEDKQIEKYTHLKGIHKVIKPYNRIREKLGTYFKELVRVSKNFASCMVI